MKRATLALLLATALCALPAPAQVTLGRLFSTPEERAAMEASRGGTAALLPNSEGQAPAPGTPGGPAAAADAASPGPAAAAPSSLTMNGVLRSSRNHTTIWLNGVPQTVARGQVITLPSGKKLQLKPGQRYDLNEGRIKDINEP